MCPAWHPCRQLCWAVTLRPALPDLAVPCRSPPPAAPCSQRFQTQSVMETAPRQQPGDPSIVCVCWGPSLGHHSVTIARPEAEGWPRAAPGLTQGRGACPPSPMLLRLAAALWPLVRAPLCLHGAAQSHLWCETGGNKEHCLDARPSPSSATEAARCFSQQQCPPSPLIPHGAPWGQGRAGASPWPQCHPARQQGAVPGAYFPGTADGVGEAAGPARPRTSAPTLSMSDSRSCQGLTGLMIVGAAGQEPLGTGQAWTPASCPLQPGTGLCGCRCPQTRVRRVPGPPQRQDMSPAVAAPEHSAPLVCDLAEARYAPAVAGRPSGCHVPRLPLSTLDPRNLHLLPPYNRGWLVHGGGTQECLVPEEWGRDSRAASPCPTPHRCQGWRGLCPWLSPGQTWTRAGRVPHGWMETWPEVRKQRVMINGVKEVVMATLASLRSCPPQHRTCWEDAGSAPRSPHSAAGCSALSHWHGLSRAACHHHHQRQDTGTAPMLM